MCGCESSLLPWVGEGGGAGNPISLFLSFCNCSGSLAWTRIRNGGLCLLSSYSHFGFLRSLLSFSSSLTLTQKQFASVLPKVQIFATACQLVLVCESFLVSWSLSQGLRSITYCEENSLKSLFCPSFCKSFWWLRWPEWNVNKKMNGGKTFHKASAIMVEEGPVVLGSAGNEAESEGMGSVLGGSGTPPFWHLVR